MLLKYTNAMGLSSSVLSPISDCVHNIYTCDLSVHPATRTFCCVHKTTWSNIGSCNFTYEIMRLVFTCYITFFFFKCRGKTIRLSRKSFTVEWLLPLKQSLLMCSPCGGNLDHHLGSLKSDLWSVGLLVLNLGCINNHLLGHRNTPR